MNIDKHLIGYLFCKITFKGYNVKAVIIKSLIGTNHSWLISDQCVRTLLMLSRLNRNRVYPALPVSPPAGHHTHSAQPAASRRRAAAANRTHPEPSHTWSETQAAAGTCVTACVCSLSRITHTHTPTASHQHRDYYGMDSPQPSVSSQPHRSRPRGWRTANLSRHLPALRARVREVRGERGKSESAQRRPNVSVLVSVLVCV